MIKRENSLAGSSSPMANEVNRRQALIAAGMGALSTTVPGLVMGSDAVNSSGDAVRSEKSCIFVLLCGGPSHVDTWDMKPNAPASIRGPYKTTATQVPGMRINEMHTQLAKLTGDFTLINSMTHPGGISNHFDAMHNLLSGQSTKRVQQGVMNDQPYLGSFVAKHKPSKRNIVSNAWLIKCVGPPVFCAPNIGIGGYLGSAYAPVFVGSAQNHPAMDNFTPPPIYDLGDQARLDQRRGLLGQLESSALSQDARGIDWADLREKGYEAMTRPEEMLAGTITLVYRGDRGSIRQQLATTQVDYLKEVISSQHVFLEDDQSLEVLLVQGPAVRLEALCDALRSIRGVNQLQLVTTTALLPPLHKGEPGAGGDAARGKPKPTDTEAA